MTMLNLFCGDCTTILKEIPVPSNSVIVTDPPFNIGYKYKSYGDKRKETEYLAWLVSVIGDRPSVLIHYPEMLFKIAKALDKVPQRVISWCYNSNTARQHRDVAFFDVKPVMKQVTQPYKNPNDKRIKKKVSNGLHWCGDVRLVRRESSQKRKQGKEWNQSSVHNAFGSHGTDSWCSSKGRDGH